MKRQLSDSEGSPVKRPAGEIASNPERENVIGGLKAPGATTSGTLFGNFGTFSFGTIKPKENPFGEKSNDNPWAERGPALGDDTKKDKYAQVELKQQTVETGEENESTIFTSRARLYALNFADTAAGWKERGVGVLKVNVDDSNRARMVMRSEGLLRVVLNMPLAKNTQIGKGFKSSLVTEKFVQIVGIEKEIPHKYALKLPSKELASELFDILDARPETVVEVEKHKSEQDSSQKTAEKNTEAKLVVDNASAGQENAKGVSAKGELNGPVGDQPASAKDEPETGAEVENDDAKTNTTAEPEEDEPEEDEPEEDEPEEDKPEEDKPEEDKPEEDGPKETELKEVTSEGDKRKDQPEPEP